MAFAFAIRVFKLDTIPANTTADETGSLRDAWHVLAGTGPGPFGFDWTGLPAFNVYTMAGVMKVFSESAVFGIRMYPVLLSVGVLAAFFFLARESLSRWASLLAMLLLASNVWFLNFSRTAWPNMNSSVFAMGGALMLALAIRKGKWYWYAAAGVFAALGLYGYFSGRIIVALFVAYLPVALALNWQKRREIVRGYGILLSVSFLLFLPQIKPLLDTWHVANGRITTTTIFHVVKPYYGETNLVEIIVRQVVWAARGFILIDNDGIMQHGSLWPRYIERGQGLLDPSVRILFLLGLFVAVWRWRKTSLWWLMFLGPVFTIQVLSAETPDAARGIIVAPFMFLFVGAGIDFILIAGKRINRFLRGASVGTASIAAVCVLLFAGRDVHQYFHWIGTDDALNARRPAISHEVYSDWQLFERVAASQSSKPFDFYDYCVQQQLPADDSSATGRLCHDTAPEAMGGGWKRDVAGRDAQRVGDLRLLSDALSKYRSKYGSFPNTNLVIEPVCLYGQTNAGCDLFEFLESVSQSRNLEERTKTYWYMSDGNSYALYASLEAAPPGGFPCAIPKALANKPNLYCIKGP
jgi:4-amino-4-deoxy-L-arabinose transferase-like glycosyltransferase